MEALFIGHAYIDVTMLTDAMPHGDGRQLAKDYAVSFGGNAVTAAFACAKLGHKVDLLTTLAPDWLGHMFMDMATKYGVRVHPRKVARSSLSFVLPNNGKRAILRARDENFLEDFPRLDINSLRLLHVDGHLADAAMHYARKCRESGVLTSIDGGDIRHNTLELLEFIDVAVVAEHLCEELALSETDMLGLSQDQGLPDRRRDQRREGHALVQ